MGGVVNGTAITKPTMGSACIVVDAEVLNDDPGLREGPQLLAVETFITKAAMEGFDESVLPCTGRLDVDCLDSLPGQPRLEFMGNELRAVVRADILRRAVLLDGLAHPWHQR